MTLYDSLVALPLAQIAALALAYQTFRSLSVYAVFAVIERRHADRIVDPGRGPSKKQVRSEWIATVRSNVIEAAVLTTIVASASFRAAPLSLGSFLLAYVVSYVAFDAWFYATHRLFHTRLFAPIHAQHHRSYVVSPASALSLSTGEKLLNSTGMLLVPTLLSGVLPMAFEGVVAYQFFNFAINVMGHSNMELLSDRVRSSWFGKVFVSSTLHAAHHTNGRENYGLFLVFFDRFFGTLGKRN